MSRPTLNAGFVLRLAIIGIALVLAWPYSVRAAGPENQSPARAVLATSVPGLALRASPFFADVGDNVLLVLSAASWPGRVSASVSFLSAHHGFTGPMLWNGSCSCFRIAVSLAKRNHPLEQARAVATVVLGQSKFTASTAFMIRGLASNGIGFASGGPRILSAWVSDPQPAATEQVHFCAWIKTPDGLGVRGMPVKFSLRYGKKSTTWKAGLTNASGIVCSDRRVPSAAGKKTVVIDAYSGALHAQTRLTSSG